MDQLSSHKNKLVLNRLIELQIQPVFFPTKTSADLSPCDNFFFHAFKQKFRKILPKSTLEEISRAAREAYRDVPEQTVRSCWRKCGLLLVPDPRITLQNQFSIDFVDSDNDAEKAEIMGDQYHDQDGDSSSSSDSDDDTASPADEDSETDCYDSSSE
jgi:hypothetical protein